MGRIIAGRIATRPTDRATLLMLHLQIIFAWSWITIGMVSGAVIGLMFHKSQFLGGYHSWTRRLLRLGHIAFLGTSILNLLFVFTMKAYAIPQASVNGPAVSFMVGAVAMPIVCWLAAWKKPFRHLFFIPVVALLSGVFFTLSLIIQAGGTS